LLSGQEEMNPMAEGTESHGEVAEDAIFGQLGFRGTCKFKKRLLICNDLSSNPNPSWR